MQIASPETEELTTPSSRSRFCFVSEGAVWCGVREREGGERNRKRVCPVLALREETAAAWEGVGREWREVFVVVVVVVMGTSGCPVFVLFGRLPGDDQRTCRAVRVKRWRSSLVGFEITRGGGGERRQTARMYVRVLREMALLVTLEIDPLLLLL